MDELHINYKKIEQKYIETLSELFIEKFKLDEQNTKTTKEILHDCDGIIITTWILAFN